MNESRESSDARGVFGSHPNTNLPNTTSARVQSDYRSKPASQRYGKAEGSRMLTLKYALGSLLGTSDCVKFSTPAYDELIKRLSDDTIRDEAKAPASATILNANQGRPIAHQLTRERTPNKAHLTNDRLAINEKSNNADGAILNILVMTLGAGKGKADITNRANIPWNYKVWTDPSGRVQATGGVLLPRGYKLHTNLQFPWVCPIRSCRVLFSSMHGLSSHFNRVHRSSLLNDNEDGTLSVVKKGTDKVGAGPARIVSQRPFPRSLPWWNHPAPVNRRKITALAFHKNDGASSTASTTIRNPSQLPTYAPQVRKAPEAREIINVSSSHSLPSQSGTRNTPCNIPNGIGAFGNGNASRFDPAQLLQLEPWEIAPGRIRDDQSNTINNVAFSNAYLAQNQAVRISRDVSFQVITIKPGTVHNWAASADKLQLCPVASGKLEVKIQGHEFTIGTNGMVQIRPGVGCTVINRLYVDAMVHVTVMPSDLWG